MFSSQNIPCLIGRTRFRGVYGLSPPGHDDGPTQSLADMCIDTERHRLTQEGNVLAVNITAALLAADDWNCFSLGGI
jgi:hypothetical protein